MTGIAWETFPAKGTRSTYGKGVGRYTVNEVHERNDRLEAGVLDVDGHLTFFHRGGQRAWVLLELVRSWYTYLSSMVEWHPKLLHGVKISEHPWGAYENPKTSMFSFSDPAMS